MFIRNYELIIVEHLINVYPERWADNSRTLDKCLSNLFSLYYIHSISIIIECIYDYFLWIKLDTCNARRYHLNIYRLVKIYWRRFHLKISLLYLLLYLPWISSQLFIRVNQQIFSIYCSYGHVKISIRRYHLSIDTLDLLWHC